MYERAMVLRRLRRRMRIRRASTLAEYLEILRGQPEEPRALANDLLLNVREFFRDAEASRILERLIGEILDRTRDQGQIRLERRRGTDGGRTTAAGRGTAGS